jgi:hypothetical protein
MIEDLKQITGKPWTGFNGAMLGIRLDDMAFFLDWYYGKWKFDELLIVYDPWGLRPGRMPRLQERLSKPPFERWAMRHSALMAIRGQWRERDKSRDNIVRGQMQLDAMNTTYGWARTVYALAPRRFQTAEALAENQAGQMIDPRKTPPAPYDRSSEELVRIRDWADENGVRVWWTLLPYSPLLQPLMHESYNNDSLRSQLAELLSDTEDQYILDLTDLESGYDPDDFFDATHMLPNTAKKFSHELAKRWAEALSSSNSSISETP